MVRLDSVSKSSYRTLLTPCTGLLTHLAAAPQPKGAETRAGPVVLHSCALTRRDDWVSVLKPLSVLSSLSVFEAASRSVNCHLMSFATLTAPKPSGAARCGIVVVGLGIKTVPVIVHFIIFHSVGSSTSGVALRSLGPCPWHRSRRTSAHQAKSSSERGRP